MRKATRASDGLALQALHNVLLVLEELGKEYRDGYAKDYTGNVFGLVQRQRSAHRGFRCKVLVCTESLCPLRPAVNTALPPEGNEESGHTLTPAAPPTLPGSRQLSHCARSRLFARTAGNAQSSAAASDAPTPCVKAPVLLLLRDGVGKVTCYKLRSICSEHLFQANRRSLSRKRIMQLLSSNILPNPIN